MLGICRDKRFVIVSCFSVVMTCGGGIACFGTETDDGFRFDFKHDRIVIDAKTPVGLDSGGGFGPTVELDDGTLVTSYSYRGATGGGTDLNIEVARWRLPKSE